MALDVLSSGLPQDVVFIRGAQTPAGSGAIDGWREDLASLNPNGSVLAPGDNYVPHLGHKETALAVAKVLAEAENAVLLLCHSYGGNIAYQVLKAVPEFAEKVSGVVYMASPMKMQVLGFWPEPVPDVKSPVIGFSGTHDLTVPPAFTGSRIDTSHYTIDCGHNDFLQDPAVRAAVLAVLTSEFSQPQRA